MAKEVQRRGGTTAQHAAFTGAAREITIDTDKNTAVVHDGVTPGGHPLATAAQLGGAITDWWSGYSSAVGQAVATAANSAAALAAIGGMPRTIETVDVAYAATINIDFAADNGKTLIVATLTGPLTFTFSNIAQGRAVSVDLLCDATQRALTFPAATPFVGTKPSNIAANKAASLTFECRRSGTTDASVRAAYGVQS